MVPLACDNSSKKTWCFTSTETIGLLETVKSGGKGKT